MDQPYFAVYVKDDFKLRPNLTLNLGLRWNLDVPRKESYNDTSNFDPTAPNPGAGGHPGALVFGNNCHGCNPKWADTYYKAWAPRIGFAWTPGFLNKRAVLRGGYGIYYSPLQYTDFGGNMQQGFSSSPTVRQREQLFAGLQLGYRFPERDASAIARSDSEERPVRHGLHQAGIRPAGTYPELDHPDAAATD